MAEHLFTAPETIRGQTAMRCCNACGVLVAAHPDAAWPLCEACESRSYLRCFACGTWGGSILHTPHDEPCDGCGRRLSVVTEPCA